MNGVLVFFLALLWALVILPSALRARRSSPVSSVGTFERAMDVLARRDPPDCVGDGRRVYVPRDAGLVVGDRASRRQAVLGRRRRVFVRLLVLTGLSAVAAFVGGGDWWAMFVMAAASFVAYVALLLRWKSHAEQAAQVIRSFPDMSRERTVLATALGGHERELVRVGAHTASGAPPVQPSWEPRPAVRMRRWEASGS